MSESALQASQLAMARYLRDPARYPPPADIEPRRLKIYQRLIYNNIESFISSGFPVLRSLYDDSAWHSLVGEFIGQHSCHTPYFLEISQEFLHFVMNDYQLQESDPPFLAELAHYEWVELALDIAQDVLPPAVATDDIASAVVHLSPLAWSLRYRFPVHRIGPGFRPDTGGALTYLVVYRDRCDRVGFMELNSVTARLLELVSNNTSDSAGTLLVRLAGELSLPCEQIRVHGTEQLRQFVDRAVVLVSQL